MIPSGLALVLDLDLGSNFGWDLVPFGAGDFEFLEAKVLEHERCAAVDSAAVADEATDRTSDRNIATEKMGRIGFGVGLWRFIGVVERK